MVTSRMLFNNFVVMMIGIFFFFGCGSGDREGRQNIQVNGSDTEVNLVQSLAEHYMDNNPNVRISVTGGGSGTGIAAIINGQTDIANSSRAMRDSEIEQARQRGIEPLPIVFAMDGLAIVTHESNPLESLTIDQISKIYRGEITNWSEVGGPDQPITLYGRPGSTNYIIRTTK